MQIVLISIMIILVLLSIYQERKLSRLRKKTLAAFRIVCKRIDKKKVQNKFKKTKKVMYIKERNKKMQIALISIISILLLVAVYQERKIKRLQEKTIDAFRIICKKINKNEI